MAKNTETVCTQVAQFNSNVVIFAARGVRQDVVLGETSFVDLKMTDDVFFTGGDLRVKDAAFGDYCDMQVVDLDGIVAPAGYVIRQFVTSYYLSDRDIMQGAFDLPYPAKIIAGLYLRLVYHSTGTIAAPKVAMNYNLHQVLK